MKPEMCGKYLLLLALSACAKSEEDVTFISKSRTPELETYKQYYNAVMLYFVVPLDTVFASFKFVAFEEQKSIFSCSSRDVSLYLKFGSPPFINPDNSKYPNEIVNTTYSQLYNVEFSTDEKEVYINISSPDPGSYYAAVFLTYTDPRNSPITQQGLSPSCNAIAESELYVKKIRDITLISEGDTIDVLISPTESRYFKFYTPNSADYAILSLVDFPDSDIIIRYHFRRPPSSENFKDEFEVTPSGNSSNFLLDVEADKWHYLEFSSSDNKESRVSFKIKLVSYRNTNESKYVSQSISNVTLYNVTAYPKRYYDPDMFIISSYDEYDLNRVSKIESFMFSYDLDVTTDILIPINVTNQHFTTLKFVIRDTTDVGGALHYILAFKPRISKQNGRLQIDDEPENNTLIGCIENNNIPVPLGNKKCFSHGITSDSNLIVNGTVSNSSILIPYPETGTWYASFRLICGKCEICECPKKCQDIYNVCIIDCQLEHNGSIECINICTEQMINTPGCEECDCDGPCKRSDAVCNSSVLFDISSSNCYYGSCGKNGRCMYVVAGGLVYSTCMCLNNYRGFACSDDSLATPFYLVVIELLLLVLSNLAFLPSVYIAYKRAYYVEGLSYFAICFFSIFYHACDAGEHRISYCLTSLNSLQFGDFFCALLAIWLTMIAMADVHPLLTTLLQMGGAIVLAFCTTVNRTALWIFMIPSCCGVLLVGVSWYLKYRKVKQRFANRKYLYVHLPVGVLLVGVGLLIYSFFQTESNYKYLHSLWHMLMAGAVIILLPKKDTFHPQLLL